MAQNLLQDKDKNQQKNIQEIKEEVLVFLGNIEGIKVEYFEIVAQNTLISLDNLAEKTSIALCIVAFLGEIRLIDNLLLKM